MNQLGKTRKSRSLYSGVLVGVGMMAAVDEIIFHQILAWHHFYDRSTTEVGLMTDGLLHAAELIAIVAGFFLLLDLRRENALYTGRAWSGFFLGLGGFQLFDGIVDHKILRLHQIRYVENLYIYDVVWNLAAVVLLIIGFYLLSRTKKAENAAHSMD